MALAPAAAIAEPARVEVRAPPGAAVPPGMIDTLRIHLDGVATVTEGAVLTGDTLPGRIDEASGALPAGGLVAWVEPADAERGVYLLVIVGQRDGRAAVEVGHV